ncbi:uncharacterized protein [Panulirus ornatus]|uniref:uncharacterized protein n=1 Tax=Panulirus ornatus TaxID=150431 RepID=UPI003A8AAB4C
MMVTRHTIDQILSYGHTTSTGPDNARSSPPTGPHNTRFSPPTDPHNTRSSPPTGPYNTRFLPPTGRHNTRSSTPTGPYNTRFLPPTGPHNTRSLPLPGPGNNRSSPDHKPSSSPSSYPTRTPPAPSEGEFIRDSYAGTDARDVAEDSKPGLLKSVAGPVEPPEGYETCEGTVDEDTSAITQEEAGRTTLARPVALRPAQRPPVASRDIPVVDVTSSGLRVGMSPEVLWGGVGYSGMESLGARGGLYGLMLRQYMEAHLHTLATTRTIMPLPYPTLDAGLGYHLPGRSRRRGGQVRFTCDQTRRLETYFSSHKYITPPQRKVIARDLNLHERQVKTWFQNRRAKWRKVQAQNSGIVPLEAGASPATSHEDSDEDPMEGKHTEEALNKDDHNGNSHQEGRSDERAATTKDSERKSIFRDLTSAHTKYKHSSL